MVIFANRVSRITILMIVAAALLLATWIASPAHAQTPSVTASVDRPDLTMSDVLTLTLRIEGVSSVHPLPKAPVINGLVLVGSERRSNQTFAQGALSAQFEFKFRYQPLRTGAIAIDPINVILDNVVHVTNPITVNVTGGPQASQQPAGTISQPSTLAGQDFFAEAEVDDETPYVGQQITYTLRFYSANVFARPIYDAPDFAGFWNPGKSTEEEGLANVSGRSYRVTEAKTVLFPTLAGDITIESTSVSVRGGLFGSDVTDFPTSQIDLTVRPLPTNEPDAFTGAVGRYSMSAEIDTDTVDLGDPVTLTLTISGEGNIESLPAPDWPDIAGWRALDNDAPYQTSVTDGKVQGTRKFERVLISNVSGTYELPPVEYAYFDPYLEEYVTLRSQSFRVEVGSDPNSPALDLEATSEEGDEAEPDIRYIKPAPGSFELPEQPVTSSIVFWGLWLTPLAGVIAIGAWLVFVRRQAAASLATGPSLARQAALSRLTSIAPGASYADAASMAFQGYLDVSLGRVTGGLPPDEVSRLLVERGVSSETSSRVTSLLDRLDRTRFAPSEPDASEAFGQEVEEAVRRLDEELEE